MNKNCPLCNQEKILIKHHTSYLPIAILFVCKSCHDKIHNKIYPDLLPSNTRFAKILHSTKGRIQVFKNGRWYQRKLTEFELALRKEMIKEEKELLMSH